MISSPTWSTQQISHYLDPPSCAIRRLRKGKYMRIASILIILVSMTPLLTVDATDYKKVQAGATGTLVGWGVGNVATGLTGITSIAKGNGGSLMLREDGTLLVNGQQSLSGVIAFGGNTAWVYAIKADGTVFERGCGDSCNEDPLTSVAQVHATAYLPNCARVTYRKQDGSIYTKF